MHFGEPFGGLFPGARSSVLAALLRTGSGLTGRQVHALLRDQHSLWSVQQALAALVDLGVLATRSVGRATVHEINEEHYSIASLRTLADPFAALRSAVRDAVGSNVEAVILFGSVARGDSTSASDVDLAVIAPPVWRGRSDLEDRVRDRLGNACDVVLFTADQFAELASNSAEPIVRHILDDGVLLYGSLPHQSGAA